MEEFSYCRSARRRTASTFSIRQQVSGARKRIYQRLAIPSVSQPILLRPSSTPLAATRAAALWVPEPEPSSSHFPPALASRSLQLWAAHIYGQRVQRHSRLTSTRPATIRFKSRTTPAVPRLLRQLPSQSIHFRSRRPLLRAGQQPSATVAASR